MIGLLRRGLMLGGVMLLVLTARLGGVKGGVDECRAVAMVSVDGTYALMWDPRHPALRLHLPIKDYAPIWDWRSETGLLVVPDAWAANIIDLKRRQITYLENPPEHHTLLYGWGTMMDARVVLQAQADGTDLLIVERPNRPPQVLLAFQGAVQTIVTSRNLRKTQAVLVEDYQWWFVDAATATLEPIHLMVPTTWADFSDDGQWVMFDGLLYDDDGSMRYPVTQRFHVSDQRLQMVQLPPSASVIGWWTQSSDWFLIRSSNDLHRVNWNSGTIDPIMMSDDTGRQVGDVSMVGWAGPEIALLEAPIDSQPRMVRLNVATGAYHILPEGLYSVHWIAPTGQMVMIDLGASSHGNTYELLGYTVATDTWQTLTQIKSPSFGLSSSPCGDTYALSLTNEDFWQWGVFDKIGTVAVHGSDFLEWLDWSAQPWHQHHPTHLLIGGAGGIGAGLVRVGRRRHTR